MKLTLVRLTIYSFGKPNTNKVTIEQCKKVSNNKTKLKTN